MVLRTFARFFEFAGQQYLAVSSMYRLAPRLKLYSKGRNNSAKIQATAFFYP